MDNSHETGSFTENSPLIEKTPTPVIIDRDTPATNSRASIFTCAVVSILFTELCERLCFYSATGNLVYFATEKDHLDMSPAGASVLSFMFTGICCMMPMLGGWLADSKAGKFSAILFSTIIYLLGTLLLPLGSIAKNDNNEEKSQWAANDVTTNPTFMRAFFITGLFVVAVGTGGIRANVSPFGAEQVSHRGPAAIKAFFSWYYWFINIGALLASTFVVYLQQNVSFFYGNLVPACFLILALIIFLSGKQAYVCNPPTGSVLTNVLNIIKEAIERSRRPALSNSFVNHWLDRAKVCFGGSYSSSEVEDVKKVFRILPIFGSFILYWTVYCQMNTSMIYQGKNMDIQINGFVIPVASLSVLDIVAVLVIVPIMNKLVYPLLAKFEIRPSLLQRIGFGMIITTASMVCAGGLELYRVKQCCMYQHRPGDDNENGNEVANITIFYQIPQYTLIGLSEVFTSIAGFELAYTEAPKSLQGVIMGLYQVTTGLGGFAGAALVGIVNSITDAVNGVDGKWYPDQKYVNKSNNLAYFFFLLAELMFLNFIVYIFVALSFKKKKESAGSTSMNDGIMNKVEPSKPSCKSKPGHDDWTSGHSAGNNVTLS